MLIVRASEYERIKLVFGFKEIGKFFGLFSNLIRAVLTDCFESVRQF